MLLGCQRADRPPTVSLQDHQLASSSMAPGLLGPLLHARCTHCNRLLPIAAETIDLRLTTRCLGCGGQCKVDPQVIPGGVTRVELRGNRPIARENLRNENRLAAPTASDNHAASSSLGPFCLQRFERLVIHDPQTGQNQVKRLWGLPGEWIEFRDGDLWINDRLYQKSIEELADIGVPVAEYRSPSRLGGETAPHPDRYRLYDRQSLTNPQALWRLEPAEPFGWLYRRPARVSLQDTSPDQWLAGSVLVDDYSCNQGISRQLNTVSDWLLLLELAEPLWVEGTDVGLTLQVTHLDRVIAIDLLANRSESTDSLQGEFQPESSESAATSITRRHSIACRQRLEVAYCDQRLLLRSDLETRQFSVRSSRPLSDPSELANRGALLGEAPFELEIVCRQAKAIAVESLQLRRDLHLVAATATAHWPTRWLVPVAGLFVLGDNLPISIDSRSDLGLIQAEQVIGKLK